MREKTEQRMRRVLRELRVDDASAETYIDDAKKQ